VRLLRARGWTPQSDGRPRPPPYDDFRKVLAAKNVDAVVIATPDHWHAEMTILACEAGKDVYVEEARVSPRGRGPGHDPMPSPEQANRAGRDASTAPDHMAEAARIVQGGKIGEVHFRESVELMAPAMAARPSRMAPPAARPENWDAWLGPAPFVPFNRNRLGYRSWMDYTNGLITDYGTTASTQCTRLWARKSHRRRILRHPVQQAQRRRPVRHEQATLSTRITSSATRHAITRPRPGRQDAPACATTTPAGTEDRPHGMGFFYGTEGTLFVDRIGMELYPEPMSGPPRAPARREGDSGAAPRFPGAGQAPPAAPSACT